MPQIEEVVSQLNKTCIDVSVLGSRIEKTEKEMQEIKDHIIKIEERLDKKMDKLLYFLLGVFGIVALHLFLTLIALIGK